MEQYSKCIDCHQGFFYRRAEYQGRVRSVCDKCVSDHKKKGTRERVRKFRMNAKKNDVSPAVTVHIGSCNGKSFCGRAWTAQDAATLSGEILKGHIKGSICKSCLRGFEGATGGVK